MIDNDEKKILATLLCSEIERNRNSSKSGCDNNAIENEGLKKHIEVLTSQFQVLTVDNEAKDEAISRYSSLIIDSIDRNCSTINSFFSQTIEAKTRKLNQMEKIIQKLGTQIAKFNLIFHEIVKENKQLKGKMQITSNGESENTDKEEINSNNESINDLREQLKNEKFKVIELQSQIANKNQQFFQNDDEIKNLKLQNSILLQEKASLEERLESFKNEKQHVSQPVIINNDINEKHELLRAKADNLKKIAELEKMIDSLTSDQQMLKNENVNNKKVIIELETENASLKAKLATSTTSVDRSEIDAALDQIRILESEREEAKNQISKLANIIADQKNSFLSSFEEVQKDFVDTKLELQNTQEKISNIQKDNENLEILNQLAERKAKRIENEKENAENALKLLKTQLNEANNQLNDYLHKNRSIKDEYASLLSTLGSLFGCRKEMDSIVDKAKSIIQKSYDPIQLSDKSQMESEINRLKIALNVNPKSRDFEFFSMSYDCVLNFVSDVSNEVVPQLNVTQENIDREKILEALQVALQAKSDEATIKGAWKDFGSLVKRLLLSPSDSEIRDIVRFRSERSLEKLGQVLEDVGTRVSGVTQEVGYILGKRRPRTSSGFSPSVFARSPNRLLTSQSPRRSFIGQSPLKSRRPFQ